METFQELQMLPHVVLYFRVIMIVGQQPGLQIKKMSSATIFTRVTSLPNDPPIEQRGRARFVAKTKPLPEKSVRRLFYPQTCRLFMSGRLWTKKDNLDSCVKSLAIVAGVTLLKCICEEGWQIIIKCTGIATF